MSLGTKIYTWLYGNLVGVDHLRNKYYCNSKIKLEKTEWIMPEISSYKDIRVKNFYANKKINWKVVH